MKKLAITICLIGLAVGPQWSYALPVGIDTFQDGATANWRVNLLGFGSGSPPNVSAGGPTGASDMFMLLTATGVPGLSGGRLSVLNATQWAGNYLAAGASAITMDVNNFGSTSLALRLAFENPAGGPPTDVAFSADPIAVDAGSGWRPVVFPILPADLQAGLGSVNGALSSATILRLYHSPTQNFPNPLVPIPAIAAQLGVDNIALVADNAVVPEPSTIALLGAGILLLSCWKRIRSA